MEKKLSGLEFPGGDSADVHMSIWDTAGQERFHALGPIYYRDANGALLVYDITDSESFAKVRKWVKELRKIVGSEIAIVIAGNKVDLERNRQVDEAEVMAYAKSVNASHFYTSAKQNLGLNETFEKLATTMVERKKKKEGTGLKGLSAIGGRKASGAGKLLFVSDDDNPDSNTKKGCC